MLPLNLTIQAFGAYPNKIEIPFEKLGNSNIYLISGVTGSGKTTIFDAISFALFNSSSTSYRGNNTFRSHYAKDNIESYVEFEFLFNSNKYKIFRTPSYQRKKLKGDGYITENSKAQITLPDSKIISGVKEVDDFIVNLLGININQFSQIALLAQGEFLKLLNSDTSTRGEIFRNIFKTEDYLSFQLKIKNEFSQIKNEYELLKNSILEYVSILEFDSDKFVEMKKYFKTNDVICNFSEFIDICDNLISDDESNVLCIKNKISEISKKINDNLKNIDVIKNKINISNQIEVINNELNILKNEFADIQKKYESNSFNIEKMDNLKLNLEKLNDNYKKAVNLKEFESELLQKKCEFQNIKNTIEKINNDLTELKNNHLRYIYLKYQQNTDNYKSSIEDFTNFQKQTYELTNKYENTYHSYLNNIAGYIASELKDDCPCPVCGSLVHPNKAQIVNYDSDNLSKEYVEQLKKQLDSNKEILNQKAQNCSVLKEKIQNKLNELSIYEKKYNLKLKNDDSIILQNLDFENEIEQKQNNLDEVQTLLNEKNNEILLLNSKIETIKNELNMVDANKILDSYNDIKNQIENLSNEINEINNEYKQKNNILISCNSKLELLKSQFENLSDVDTDKMDEFVNENNLLNIENINLDNKFSAINDKFISNKKVLGQIKQKYLEYVSFEKKYNDYKILCDCANGMLKGKNRITFEHYIQGYYLDNVLKYANKILHRITLGQFQLYRKTDSLSRQGKSGLDLEVMDFHTYKKRDTKTLSGGESFKASLALALGLSQCISDFSGAINIDAMFIDEGFGSLDSESLDLALDVIVDLSSSGRLIGLISHIEELKTKVQNQIISIKTNNGSKIKLNF